MFILHDFRPITNVLWNLFLAVIPVVVAFILARSIRNHPKPSVLVKIGWAALFILWLGFLPNTCYLFTEWRHYISTIMQLPMYQGHSHTVVIRLMNSTAFYFFYSLSGMVTFFLSIWILDGVIRKSHPLVPLLFKACIFLLCSVGVYLGLIHRFNTWDLVTRAGLESILHTAMDSLTRPFILFSIVAFTIFLGLFYIAFDIWMEGLKVKLRLGTRVEKGTD